MRSTTHTVGRALGAYRLPDHRRGGAAGRYLEMNRRRSFRTAGREGRLTFEEPY